MYAQLWKRADSIPMAISCYITSQFQSCLPQSISLRRT